MEGRRILVQDSTQSLVRGDTGYALVLRNVIEDARENSV